jgi:lipopolysaccharide/colanic/teichoic acid biosynthesis glycosyltransferase
MRFLDILLSIVSLFFLLLFFILIYVINWLYTGSPLFIQSRVGLNLKNFNLIKFRTMKIRTPSFGTHLINRSNVTYFGYFLRKFKLDELPQLLNVLMGHMSLVGPRPCLFNQRKLISERKKLGIFKVRPGITGLPQATGITMATPTILAQADLKMIKQMNLYYYFYYITITSLLIFRKKI